MKLLHPRRELLLARLGVREVALDGGGRGWLPRAGEVVVLVAMALVHCPPPTLRPEELGDDGVRAGGQQVRGHPRQPARAAALRCHIWAVPER